MDANTSRQIQDQTRDVYNQIAGDFSNTRKLLWTGLKDFLEYVKPGDRILDVGCGNGRLIQMFKDVEVDYTGLDASDELIKIAQQKHPEQKFITGDAAGLPFPDDSFDSVLIVAVLHHIPGKANRQAVLNEIKRVLKPNGYLFATSWWRLHPDYLKLNLAPLLRETCLKFIGRSELDFMDAWVPWGNNGQKRYYHYFTTRSQKNEIKRAGFQILKNHMAKAYAKSHKRMSQNIITIAQK